MDRKAKRAQASERARAIMKLEFGDYARGTGFAKLEQLVIDGYMATDKILQKILDEVKEKETR
jgi:hypothetical protein